MKIQNRNLQYTVDEEGKGDLLGLVCANQPHREIRGNGTLQDPLRVVFEDGHVLVDLAKLRAWGDENGYADVVIRAILASAVAA